MSWIQQNSYIAKLAGVTLIGTVGLLAVGQYFRSNYQNSLDQIHGNTETISKGQSLPFYPNEENLTAKEAAIKNYGETVAKLEASFSAYRSKAGVTSSPQQLADEIKRANEKVATTFSEKKIVTPPAFFMGFESYKSGLANPAAAPILSFELQALTEVYLQAANAGITEIKNVTRDKLPEESGAAADAKASAPYRVCGVELVFRGSEDSLRKLLSSLVGSKSFFYVVNNVRIKNDRDTAPKQDDVKFEAADQGAAAEQAEFAGATADGAASAPMRKLKEVAGKEQLSVFLKLNILQFTASK